MLSQLAVLSELGSIGHIVLQGVLAFARTIPHPMVKLHAGSERYDMA